MRIIALYLMVRKIVEHWLLWIIADTLFMVYFIHLNLYLSSLLYALFFVLPINGYRNWRKISGTAPMQTATLSP